MTKHHYTEFGTVEELVKHYGIDFDRKAMTDFDNNEISNIVDDLMRVLFTYETNNNISDGLDGNRVKNLKSVIRELATLDEQI